jgi:transposase-like protein
MNSKSACFGHLNSDGETSMRKTKHNWAGHVAAIKTQGISPIAYAKQHGLVQSTLYRWLHKLQVSSSNGPPAKTLTTSTPPAKFIALRLSEPERMVASPVPTHCNPSTSERPLMV